MTHFSFVFSLFSTKHPQIFNLFLHREYLNSCKKWYCETQIRIFCRTKKVQLYHKKYYYTIWWLNLLSVFIVTRGVLSRKQWCFDLKTKKLVLCVTKRLLCTEKLRFMRANSQNFFGCFAPWNPTRVLPWTHWGANSAPPGPPAD